MFEQHPCVGTIEKIVGACSVFLKCVHSSRREPLGRRSRMLVFVCAFMACFPSCDEHTTALNGAETRWKTQVEYMVRCMKKWGQENGIKI